MASSQHSERLTSSRPTAEVPFPESSTPTWRRVMKLTIYHNPRCSKSRKTLEIIRENGVEPEVVEYLDSVPSATTVLGLAKRLKVPVADLLRTGETEFKDGDDPPPLTDEQALAAWLERHPRVLQRPIVVDDDSDRAVIGRPPENVLELLEP